MSTFKYINFRVCLEVDSLPSIWLRNTHFFLSMAMLIGTKSNLYTWVAPFNKAYYVYREIISKDCYCTIVQHQLLTESKGGL